MTSQMIDVGIGLALTFFVVSLVASSFVELLSTVLKKRAKSLDTTIGNLLEGDLAENLKATSAYRALSIGSSRGRSDTRKPSYMSARSFANATIEMLADIKRQAADGGAQVKGVLERLDKTPIGDRLLAITAEVGEDLTAVKAQLESWFDGAMERLQGGYQRWSRWILLTVGLVFAVALNISATHIALRLWDDQVVRESVVNSADAVISDPNATDKVASMDKLVTEVKSIDELKVPIGWSNTSNLGPGGWVVVAVGWLITALMTMLGAQFWFDVLKRLTSLRGGSPRSAAAVDDPGSAVTERAMATTASSLPARNAASKTPEEQLLALLPTGKKASPPPQSK